MNGEGRKPVTPFPGPASGAGFEDGRDHGPFKPVTRVRIPLGAPDASLGRSARMAGALFRFRRAFRSIKTPFGATFWTSSRLWAKSPDTNSRYTLLAASRNFSMSSKCERLACSWRGSRHPTSLAPAPRP